MNVNAHHVGRRVRKLPSCRFVPLADVPVGAEGKVTQVESHGSNPWTRYVIEFPDGARGWGLIPDKDFEWI